MEKDSGRLPSAPGYPAEPEPVPVSALRAGIPSAEDIRKVAELFDPKAFEPIIERATQDIYERILHSCEDYLRDNIDWNIGSHIAMLSRENQRMREELWHVDKALGCLSMGHETRINAIQELHDRHNQAVNETWRLRAELAQGTEAASADETAKQAQPGGREPGQPQADAPKPSHSSPENTP